MITKSQYLKGLRCPKALWLTKNALDLEVDQGKKDRAEIGIEVGEVARGLFPGGHLIEYERKTIFELIEETKNAMESKETVYEGTFLYNDALVRCDILVYNNGWELYEVKSTTKAKEEQIMDIDFQYYVLKGLGYEVKRISLVYINSEYVRHGDLDLSLLFIIDEIKDLFAKDMQIVDKELCTMKEISKATNEPEVDINECCFEPEACEFKKHCFRHMPEKSVFDLGFGFRKDKKLKLYRDGLIAFEDLQGNSNIKGVAKLQLECSLQDRMEINKKEIDSFLKQLYYPLYFLDFESYQQAIPKFDNINPYRQIPFQYSLHGIEKEGTELKHFEFLGKEGQDPRRSLAESLIKDIPKDACILAYNMAFERTILKKLAEDFEDLKEELIIICDRIKDLMIPFQKGYYYTKAMEGSYSIKYVLPALCPNDTELNYSSLDIHNGSMAMNAFANLHLKRKDEIERTRKALLDYCKLDTLAMVKIWEVLRYTVK